MSERLQSQIDSLNYQIANYDSERYTCTRSELIYRRGRLQCEIAERLVRERKQARKAAKNRLRYYRSLVDSNGDRTHTDTGIPLYNEWGDPNF